MDVKYLELEFEQSVNFESRRIILAVARESGSGCLRLFRIDDASGKVSLRGESGWEVVGEPENVEVINRLVSAWYRNIPVYVVN